MSEGLKFGQKLAADPKLGPIVESNTNTVHEELEAQLLADSGQVASESTDEVIYSSHPIDNYAVGRFQFVKTLLKLTSVDAEEFETLVSGMPEVERYRIKKIDVQRAQAIVAQRQESSMTKQFDSSVGADAIGRLGSVGELVGTKALEDLNNDSGASE